MKGRLAGELVAMVGGEKSRHKKMVRGGGGCWGGVGVFVGGVVVGVVIQGKNEVPEDNRSLGKSCFSPESKKEGRASI